MGQSRNKKRSNTGIKAADNSIWMFGLCILSVIVYRMIILADYASKYVDDDQALMWYGTAAAARFAVREPHFLGQAYGSMIESFVAVPFYWLGIPLNICLPLATLIIWFFPFVYLGIKMIKKNKLFAFIIPLIGLFFSWEYDILTAVPRAFIGGFWLAFIGVVLLFEDKKWKKTLALIFMTLAFINSETSIAISALGILYYLLFHKDKLRDDWKSFLISLPFCVVIYSFCNIIFYKLFSDYNLHGSNSLSISADAFINNIKSLGKLLSDFSLLHIGTFPLLLIIIIFGLLIIGWLKDKKLFIIQLCAVIGSLLFLALPKTLDHTDELLFSQTRMFLYIPYVLLIVVYFYGREIQFEKTEKYYGVICCLGIILCIGKGIYFENTVIKDQNLYQCSITPVWNVETINGLADEFKGQMNSNGCKKQVFLNGSRALAYATSAVNYDEYLSYFATYDRRTPVYLKLKDEVLDENVMFVYIGNDGTLQSAIERVSGTNLIDYLRIEKGLQRYIEGDPRYIQ